MTLSSSVIEGRNATGLNGPMEGTMLKIGVVFLSPKIDISRTNCSLVIASMPFTICKFKRQRFLKRNKLALLVQTSKEKSDIKQEISEAHRLSVYFKDLQCWIDKCISGVVFLGPKKGIICKHQLIKVLEFYLIKKKFSKKVPSIRKQKG